MNSKGVSLGLPQAVDRPHQVTAPWLSLNEQLTNPLGGRSSTILLHKFTKLVTFVNIGS